MPARFALTEAHSAAYRLIMHHLIKNEPDEMRKLIKIN